jgi:hypothetical protein
MVLEPDDSTQPIQKPVTLLHHVKHKPFMVLVICLFNAFIFDNSIVLQVMY